MVQPTHPVHLAEAALAQLAQDLQAPRIQLSLLQGCRPERVGGCSAGPGGRPPVCMPASGQQAGPAAAQHHSFLRM